MKTEFIYKYFYYFLNFILLYQDQDHLSKNYDFKIEFMDRMSDLNQEQKLYEIDKRFSEMIYDMETCIFAKEDLKIIINEYKDFIKKYK